MQVLICLHTDQLVITVQLTVAVQLTCVCCACCILKFDIIAGKYSSKRAEATQGKEI